MSALTIVETSEIENPQEELAFHEAVIERAIKSSVEMGFSLAVIKAKSLYEPLGFKDFDSYVLARWEMEVNRARQLIRAAQTVANIKKGTNVPFLPDSEGQVRPISSLSAEAQPIVWQAAVSMAQEKNVRVTGAIVELAVQQYKMQTEKKKEAKKQIAGRKPEIPETPKAKQPEPPQSTPSSGIEEFFGDPLTLTIAQLPPPPKPANVAKFNRTNDNVEWALWTWNPVTGCLHNCPYCYARDITKHYPANYPKGFEPMLWEDRIQAPRYMKVPDAASENIGEKNVFVCSMADLWGKWVPSEWIDIVLEEVRNAPQWNFLFLTKFPARYEEYAGKLPPNAWIGTSVDRQHAVDRAEKAFKRVKAAGYEGIAWLSCEPMLERLTFSSLSMFDWVVVGGASRSSQTPEFMPPYEWIDHLYHQSREANCQFYMKTNLFGSQYTGRIREYPTGIVRAAPAIASVTPKASTRFVPPACSEVTAYMTEIGIPHLASAWHDYYSANGWKVGRNPMKDWKASCRMWRDKHKQTPAAPQILSGSLEERKSTIHGWLNKGGLS